MKKGERLKTVLSTFGIILLFVGVWISHTGCWVNAGPPLTIPKVEVQTPAQPPGLTPVIPSQPSTPVIPSAPQTPLADGATLIYEDTPTTGQSCPYLYAWNGTGYVLDNDIIPFKGSSLENNDYYRMQRALKPEDGYYKMRIAENLPETSYLDSVRLVTIDHPAAVEVYPDLTGNLFNISNPKPLISCVDSRGNNCLDMLKQREEVYIPGTFFEGSPGDYIIADFGNLSGNKIIKLVVTSDGLVDTSPLPSTDPNSVGPSSGGTSGPKSIRIESLVTQNGTTSWETRFIFTPHELWATNVFDITNVLPDADGNYRLRFLFTNTHKVDFIGIDTTPEVEKVVHELAPAYAVTSQDVLSRVAATDGNYLVMKKGDELFLRFPYQPSSDRGNFKRDFVFVSRGYYIPDQK